MEVVGRDAEWGAVERWLATRDPAVLVVHGEAGIGKTTLWSASVRAAGENGERLLAHTATWSEAQLSLHLFEAPSVELPFYRIVEAVEGAGEPQVEGG